MKWREIARKALKSDGLIGTRTKIKTDELIAKYPDCVSITGVTIIEYADTSYPAFTFAEDPTRYFTGGLKLRNMVNALIEAGDGDLSGANEEFSQKPLRVKLFKVRTKSGNTFTNVETLDKDDEPEVDFDPETGEVISPDAPF